MVSPQMQSEMFQQLTNSPLFKRAQQMAEGKTPQELEQIARNICGSKGVNYDEAVTMFRQMVG